MLFGLTSSSRLFFSQRFGRLILRPSSGLSRTRELWNFEPNPLLFRGYHVLIPLRPLLLLLLNAVAAAAAASMDAVTAIVLSLPLHSGLNSAPWGIYNFWFNALVASAMCLLERHMAEATKTCVSPRDTWPRRLRRWIKNWKSPKVLSSILSAVAVTKQWQWQRP